MQIQTSTSTGSTNATELTYQPSAPIPIPKTTQNHTQSTTTTNPSPPSNQTPQPQAGNPQFSNSKNDHISQLRAAHAINAIRCRLRHGIGLREWEWSAGEPFDDYDESSSPPQQPDRSAPPPETYAQRRRRFTYSRGSDPLLQGRKIVMRRMALVRIADPEGEYAREVSNEDRRYRPPTRDEESRRGMRGVAGEAAEKVVTAGEFLMGKT